MLLTVCIFMLRKNQTHGVQTLCNVGSPCVYRIGVPCSIYSLQSSSARASTDAGKTRTSVYCARLVVIRQLHRLPRDRRVNYFRVSGCANTRLDTRESPVGVCKRSRCSVSVCRHRFFYFPINRIRNL